MSKIALSALAEQEAIIERGLASFVEVGNALMRIRDEELYREAGFDGFVEYLESKPWGIGQAEAYRQIQGAQVVEALDLPNPVNVADDPHSRTPARAPRHPSCGRGQIMNANQDEVALWSKRYPSPHGPTSPRYLTCARPPKVRCFPCATARARLRAIPIAVTPAKPRTPGWCKGCTLACKATRAGSIPAPGIPRTLTRAKHGALPTPLTPAYHPHSCPAGSFIL